MNGAMSALGILCGVPYPPNHQEVGVDFRCGLPKEHDGDHHAWGVFEAPGERVDWRFQWASEVNG
jgi:hypothetical protein